MCDGIMGESEAIEFAFRKEDSPWIPLRMSFRTKARKDYNTTTRIRGYTVLAIGRSETVVSEHLYICGDILHDINGIQFRWMETAEVKGNERLRSDIWALASVNATMTLANETIQIFEDNFGTDGLK